MKGFIELQGTVQALLPEDEKEHDQNDWFEPKVEHFREFMDGVQFWITENEERCRRTTAFTALH